jgi:hypothetical protein
MADPAFDGDSDHASAADRLIASVERLADDRDAIMSDPRVKALVEVMANPVRSDDGLYDYEQDVVDEALAAIKEATND